MAEWKGGGNSDDNGDTEHTAGTTIRECDHVRRRAEEVNASLMVKAALFYADYGLVDSIDPGWIQSAFDTLTEIFDWMGMQNNIRKNVGVVCRPCRADGVWADEAYTRQMTGAC